MVSAIVKVNAINRKSYNKISDIPKTVLECLNRGEEETRTLAEGLAVDFGALMEEALPDHGKIFAQDLDPNLKITGRMDVAGRFLLERLGVRGFSRIAAHPSDTVRGWAAYMIRHMPDRALDQRLAMVKPLADDPHFGVREWAWIALRPHIVAEPEEAVAALAGWVVSDRVNIRRYAVEITRPRGVWCAHIRAFREHPERGLALLDPMQAETERYAQLSVANWLNDAGKSRPDWVRETCARWQAETPRPEATSRIVRHALRNLV